MRRSLPGVRALPGSAEVIPLPDASVDAVLAGNARHWFDMAVAGPEIARVLAPGGILAGLWNVMDDRVDWMPGSRGSAGARPSARVTRPPVGAPRRQTYTCRRPVRTPGSARRSKRSSRTGSAAPPTPSSRPSRRARGCWSCSNRNVRPRSSGSAHSLRADPRPPRASSRSRC
ncbi:methyltransferase domain-containing protein [Streptomyces sp. NPDC000133]|uniref:methyltransferase domain-containing protein n=1 Tax=Streptomyces sp. NPDC000133 TaxID=3364535 RepID=UPI0036743F8A